MEGFHRRQEGEALSQLKLYLLGSPRVEQNNRTVAVRPRKALALLIYLAVTRQPHSRDTLAELFWPESDQQTARASLRRTLYQLTQSIDRALFDAEQETVRLAPYATVWLDVEVFQQSIEHSLAAIHTTSEVALAERERLAQAVDSYKDDFLAGFNLSDCPDFDDWQFFLREDLRQLLARALQALITLHAADADYEQAIVYARRWLALDTMHEAAHYILIQLYAQAGKQAAALRQYEECKRILDEELGVQPEEATTALYEAIRTKRFPGEKVDIEPEIPPRSVSTGARPAPSATRAEPAPSYPLPVDPTPFIGRKPERDQLHNLAANPRCRLITIAGLGGIGKTSLALEFAHHLRQDHPELFPHGIVFVPLADLDRESAGLTSLAYTVAEALNLSLSTQGPPLPQLLDALRLRQMLLILDNVEHLLEPAGGQGSVLDLIGAVLESAGQVKILVTSREPLRIGAEWRLDLEGLEYPSEEVAAEDGLILDGEKSASRYSAVQLFCQFAQQSQSSFALTAQNAPWVHRLCRLVTGSPLALKLAAAWVRVFSCERIVIGIEKNLDMLSSHMRDMPARQQSMRAIFDYTWDLLGAGEQELFCRLSVFRGGFDEEAATAIAGATPALMAGLLDRGLLDIQVHDGGIRYWLHELVHQYAAEKLAGIAPVRAQTEAVHAHYYLELVETLAKRLKSRERASVLALFATEYANIRAAWQWATIAQDVQAMDRYALSLSSLLERHAAEGLVLFQQAAMVLDEAVAAHRGALGVVLLAQAEQVIRLGHDPAHCSALAEQALALLPSHEAPQAKLKALNLLGNSYWLQGSYQRAKLVLEEGLAALQASGSPAEIGDFLIRLGLIEREICSEAEVIAFYQRSLEELRTLGDTVSLSHQLLIYGEYLVVNGRLQEGQRYLEESLALAEAAGRTDFFPFILLHLGITASMLGDYGRAAGYFREVLSIAQAESRAHPEALAHIFLGRINIALNALPAAEQSLLEGLKLGWTHKLTLVATLALVSFAEFFIAQKAYERAICLLVVALDHPATEKRDRQSAGRQLEALRKEMAPDEFDQIVARARQMSLEEVVEQLLLVSPKPFLG